MIETLRVALTNTALGLSWDDLSQHPTLLGKSTSWLQMSGVQVYPNKLSEITVAGRVVIWHTDLDYCERYLLKVVDFLRAYLVGECVGGFNRIQLSDFQVAYSGQVEDSELESLESYTLSLTFNLTAAIDLGNTV